MMMMTHESNYNTCVKKRERETKTRLMPKVVTINAISITFRKKAQHIIQHVYVCSRQNLVVYTQETGVLCTERPHPPSMGTAKPHRYAGLPNNELCNSNMEVIFFCLKRINLISAHEMKVFNPRR